MTDLAPLLKGCPTCYSPWHGYPTGIVWVRVPLEEPDPPHLYVDRYETCPDCKGRGAVEDD